jgi:uncharacterized membrane protein YgcG
MRGFLILFTIFFLFFSHTEAKVNTLWLKSNGQTIIDITETLEYKDKEVIQEQSRSIEKEYGIRIFTILLQSSDEEDSQTL